MSKDGLGLWLPQQEPTRAEVQRVRQQLVRNAIDAGIENFDDKSLGMIFLGSTRAYRELDEAAAKFCNDVYLRAAQWWSPCEEVFYSYDEFRQYYSGWTSVASVVIPGVGKYSRNALVPRSLIDKIEFASGVTSALFIDTDDLVAVRTNVDGSYYLFKLLCSDTRGYYECKSQYELEVFDRVTGQQIDTESFEAVGGGVVIDLNTLQPIDAETIDLSN